MRRRGQRLGAPQRGWLESSAATPSPSPSAASPPFLHTLGGERADRGLLESFDGGHGKSGDAAAQVELLMDRSRYRLSPLMVESRRFPRARWGYDRQQVQDYLRQVARELTRLHLQLLEQPPKVPAGDAGAADRRVIGRVLVLAVRTADRIVADAWMRAADIVAKAHQQAREIACDATAGALCATTNPAASPGQEPKGAKDPGAATPVADLPDLPDKEPRADSAGVVLPGPWRQQR